MTAPNTNTPRTDNMEREFAEGKGCTEGDLFHLARTLELELNAAKQAATKWREFTLAVNGHPTSSSPSILAKQYLELSVSEAKLRAALEFVQKHAVFPLDAIPERPWDVVSQALSTTPPETFKPWVEFVKEVAKNGHDYSKSIDQARELLKQIAAQ